MPVGFQAVVQEGPDLPPQLPFGVLHGGDVDEEFILEKHVDVPSLHPAVQTHRPSAKTARRELTCYVV